MTDREHIARAEIDRISRIPLRQRTEEDKKLWDLNLLRRDFAVMDTEREKAERETDIVCAKILKGRFGL